MPSTESESSSGRESSAGGSGFPETLWTLVAEASQANGGQSESALRTLCERYRDPILHRLQQQGYGQEAENLAQGFVEFLLEQNRLKNFVRGEARFRSFLLRCLKGFVRDEWRKRTAVKRGGGMAHESLEEVEVGREAEWDRLMDRRFALATHRRVVGRLAIEREKKGEMARFEQLKPYLLGGTEGGASYAEVAARLGMTPNNVKVAVLRLRGRYAELFREEVLQTASRVEVDEEMRYLITLLAHEEATS